MQKAAKEKKTKKLANLAAGTLRMNTIKELMPKIRKLIPKEDVIISSLRNFKGANIFSRQNPGKKHVTETNDNFNAK